MAFAPLSENVIGSFVEKETGNIFQFSKNPELTLAPPAHGGKNVEFPYRVWVTNPIDGIDSGWRYARIGKTVAHIIVDETDRWVIEKWNIRNMRIFDV